MGAEERRAAPIPAADDIGPEDPCDGLVERGVYMSTRAACRHHALFDLKGGFVLPPTRLLFALAIAAVGCNRAFSPGEALVGTWGGDGASATLSEGGGHLSFVCAAATLDVPLVPNSHGRVHATGVAIPVGGAARPVGYVPEPYPVSFSGNVDGSTLTLTVVQSGVENAEPAGPYVLHRGEVGEVYGCPVAAPH